MDQLENLTKEELIALFIKTVTELNARIAELEAEVKRLKGDDPDNPNAPKKRRVPEFIKPNSKPRPPTERKKRPHGFGRRRMTPTDTVDHAVERCGDCGRRLCGGWVHRTREVIDLPQTPISVIEHRVLGRHCGVCDKNWIAAPDLSQAVVGKSRIGVRLMALIAHLKTVCRMTVRGIRKLLDGLYGLALSSGEICRVLQTVADRGKAEYDHLIRDLRNSQVVHADETGWRENGKNGYAWSFSTPTHHLFVCQRNRSRSVWQEVLGMEFRGALVTDFYSAYHSYAGPHQYCWPHLLRDLHKLKVDHEDDIGVQKFSEKLKEFYQEAKEFEHKSIFRRQKKRRDLQSRVEKFARANVIANAPQRVLAERIVRHIWGLFVFVELPYVPSSNNAAERSIRPLVILRKVSGGTRSAVGSETVAVLMSLFSTWNAQGKDLLETCIGVLRTKQTVPLGNT